MRTPIEIGTFLNVQPVYAEMSIDVPINDRHNRRQGGIRAHTIPCVRGHRRGPGGRRPRSRRRIEHPGRPGHAASGAGRHGDRPRGQHRRQGQGQPGGSRRTDGAPARPGLGRRGPGAVERPRHTGDADRVGPGRWPAGCPPIRRGPPATTSPPTARCSGLTEPRRRRARAADRAPDGRGRRGAVMRQRFGDLPAGRRRHAERRRARRRRSGTSAPRWPATRRRPSRRRSPPPTRSGSPTADAALGGRDDHAHRASSPCPPPTGAPARPTRWCSAPTYGADPVGVLDLCGRPRRRASWSARTWSTHDSGQPRVGGLPDTAAGRLPLGRHPRCAGASDAATGAATRSVGTSASRLPWDVDPATGAADQHHPRQQRDRGAQLGQQPTRSRSAPRPRRRGPTATTSTPGPTSGTSEACDPAVFTSPAAQRHRRRPGQPVRRCTTGCTTGRTTSASPRRPGTCRATTSARGGLGDDPSRATRRPAASPAGRPRSPPATTPTRSRRRDGIAPITNMYLWQPIAGHVLPALRRRRLRHVGDRPRVRPRDHQPHDRRPERRRQHARRAMSESWSDLLAMEYLFEHGYAPAGHARLHDRRVRHLGPDRRHPQLQHEREPAQLQHASTTTSSACRCTPPARSGRRPTSTSGRR